MTARTGMTNLIKQLRGMTDTSTAEYTVNSVAYWTDDQVQDVLDLFRTDLERVPLRAASEYIDGDSVYKDYYTPAGTGHFEEAGTDVAIWAVRDGDGDLVATTDYTVNYANGHIRFTADQDGESFYLRARMYDLNRAAAHIWRQKAAHYVSRYDVATDNHKLSCSQLRAGALQMAAYYDQQAGIQSISMTRGDLL